MESSIKVDIGDSSYNKDASYENDILDVHKGFVFKVYGIVTFQLLITFFICLIPMCSPSLAQKFVENAVIIVLLSVSLLILSLMQLIWFSKTYRRVPFNYMLLLVISISMGFAISVACATTEALVVFLAIVMTITTTCCLTIYAFIVRDNIAFFQGMLIISANCLISMAICMLFVDLEISRAVLACIGIIIWGMYLLYDTKFLMTNTIIEISCDEYILASIILYFDIMMLFIKILDLLKLVLK